MKLLRSALLVGALSGLAIASAEASSLPAIKATSSNKVPECVTPGRLMAYLKSRNAGVEQRFDAVATEYMRHGETLAMRWDYAFYQMIVETASLKFKNGGSRGDVSPSQNNFAGIGATGKGAPGESFKDVGTGVLAHLQHLLLYAGQTVDNPVAERTRKVQEWKIVHPWAQKLGRPATYSDLAGKWAANDYKYGDTIKSVEEKFSSEFCNQPDPRPELVQEARKGRTPVVASADVKPAKPSGADLAKQAMARGQADGAPRSSLGGKAIATTPPAMPVETAAAAPTAPTANTNSSRLNVLNAPKPDAKTEAPALPTSNTAAFVQASAAGSVAAAAKPQAPAPVAAAKCRVWTASYGGQKSVIISAKADGHVNYTVLDVNDGAEKREAEAYIAAYAKGGQQVGEFSNQTQALEKAFDLCPEG